MAETFNAVFRENAERQQLIRHQAEHDALTDLLNRGSFDKLLDMYEADGSSFALIIVDVDQALYHTKRNGCCGCTIYDAEMAAAEAPESSERAYGYPRSLLLWYMN